MKSNLGRLAIVTSLFLVSGVLAAFLYLTLGPRKMTFKVVRRSSAAFGAQTNKYPTAGGDFSYHTLEGEEQHLFAAKGKVVFVNRWGTWCAPCVAEMPSIQRLYDRYKDDPAVQFLIISSMDTPAAVRTFAQRRHLDLPLYVTTDTDSNSGSGLDLSAFPSTSLYGKDGRLVSKQTGGADWSADAVVRAIEKLKAE